MSTMERNGSFLPPPDGQPAVGPEANGTEQLFDARSIQLAYEGLTRVSTLRPGVNVEREIRLIRESLGIKKVAKQGPLNSRSKPEQD